MILDLILRGLRGIHESKADLLVFVDDDNALAANFLSEALLVGRENLARCVFGQSLPEFETPPREWLKYLPQLANRDFDRDMRTGILTDAMPLGAGLCVRHRIALRFAEVCQDSPLRKRPRQDRDFAHFRGRYRFGDGGPGFGLQNEFVHCAWS